MLGGSLLNLYDFHARYYNPTLGRWFNIDPALQFGSPYVYGGNSPMMGIDPDGKWFFIDNLVIGFFKGLFRGDNPFKTAWRDGVNDLKVWAGLFQGNPLQILSRFTWEYTQTFVGFITAQGNVTFGNVEKVDYYGGATVLQNHSSGWGAFTLGSYIIGDKSIAADPSNSTFQHEYGHYLQSQASGPLYLAKYALPSLYDAIKDSDGNHYAHPTEQDANARAIAYFEKKMPGFADARIDGGDYGWDHGSSSNWIIGYDTDGGYYSSGSQAALKNAKLKAYGNVWNVVTSIYSYRRLLPVQTLVTSLLHEHGYKKKKEQNVKQDNDMTR